MKVLELFAGTGVLSDTFRKAGHEATTLEIDPQFNADIQEDILCWIPKGEYDVIWASPPCTTFSVMTMGKYWKDKTRDSSIHGKNEERTE